MERAKASAWGRLDGCALSGFQVNSDLRGKFAAALGRNRAAHGARHRHAQAVTIDFALTFGASGLALAARGSAYGSGANAADAPRT